MGLFKAVVEKRKARNKVKTFDIVCLHCFKKFTVDEVLFRAARVMDFEGLRAQEDLEINKYRRKFKMSDIGPIEAVLYPDKIDLTKKNYTDGILTSVVDDCDNETFKRICPYCHNDIPKSAGKSPSTLISIVGASQVGKSVYMTALIHVLKNVTSINFNASCLPVNQEMNRRFKDNYEDMLFEHQRLLEPTQKELLQEPLMFNFGFLDRTKPQISLVFFDVAGEGMIDQDYLDIYASHIKNSSGILFLVDPTQIKTLSSKIALKKKSVSTLTSFDEPTDVLVSLFENFIEQETDSKTKIPTAVVLTKVDLLFGLDDESYIKKNSNIYRNYVHNKHFNLSEFYNINGDVDELIKKVDPPFRNALLRHFEDVGYFAVSSLGRNPTGQKLDSVVEPMRVDEPFLWLLYKLNVIEGK